MSAQSKVVMPASANATMSPTGSAARIRLWSVASCQPPLMTREISWSGASLMRDIADKSVMVEGYGCGVSMAKAATPQAGDAQLCAAMGVRTGDFGVARHPVMPVGRALLGGEQRQHGGQR